MTIARAQLIDPSQTRWYHCVTRCVHRAFLLGDDEFNRKEWIEDRLEELADCFASAVGGFAMMNNHLHVLLRLDPDVAAGWTDKDIVERLGRLCPPRDKSRRPLPISDRGPTRARLCARRNDGRLLTGELCFPSQKIDSSSIC